MLMNDYLDLDLCLWLSLIVVIFFDVVLMKSRDEVFASARIASERNCLNIFLLFLLLCNGVSLGVFLNILILNLFVMSMCLLLSVKMLCILSFRRLISATAGDDGVCVLCMSMCLL